MATIIEKLKHVVASVALTPAQLSEQALARINNIETIVKPIYQKEIDTLKEDIEILQLELEDLSPEKKSQIARLNLEVKRAKEAAKVALDTFVNEYMHKNVNTIVNASDEELASIFALLTQTEFYNLETSELESFPSAVRGKVYEYRSLLKKQEEQTNSAAARAIKAKIKDAQEKIVRLEALVK